MKKYVFFTADIYPVGGMQLYVSGKAKYLMNEGFSVYAFFSSSATGNTAFPFLNRFKCGNITGLAVFPNQILSSSVNKELEKMKNIVEYAPDDDYFIESQNDKTAIWAELFAEKVGGKHICFNCNEVFRGRYKHYSDYLDYFWFKYKRDELYGISEKSIPMLFDGYQCLNDDKQHVFFAADDESVQDVDSDIIDNITKSEINLCYIGRIEKECFIDITDGVIDFAEKYRTKKIQYIIVGKCNSVQELDIKSRVKNIPNISVYFAGDLVPIPRKLFTKTDVVLAASGCARISAENGVLSVVADANGKFSNGILGIDTDNALFSDNHYTYIEVLENIFIFGKYSSAQIHLKPRRQNSFYYAQQVKLFLNSNIKEDYYDTNNLISHKRFMSRGTLRYYFGKD